VNRSLLHAGRAGQENTLRPQSRFAERSHQTGIAVLLVLFLLAIPTGTASAQTLHLEGTYDVYNRDVSSSVPWTTMTIYDQNEAGFSIKGNGWQGHGTLQWVSGSYDWTTSDGKTRRTTFVVSVPDGIIYGQVRDKDDPRKQFNWDFFAKLQVKPEAKSWSDCDIIRNRDLPACKNKPTPGEQFACFNELYVRWIRCVETCKL